MFYGHSLFFSFFMFFLIYLYLFRFFHIFLEYSFFLIIAIILCMSFLGHNNQDVKFSDHPAIESFQTAIKKKFEGFA